jgi:murein hydrolase activator
MTARTGAGAGRRLSVLCLAGLACLVPPGEGAVARQQRDDAALSRSAERLRALQREADALAAEQRTLLGELRKLELERQIAVEELARIERERVVVEEQLAGAERRADELAQAAATQLPQVEAQLVQLYKQGRAGYWRLLLSTGDLATLGRAYRAAAMMTLVARARAEEHYATLDALVAERKALQARADELAVLEAEARRARAASEKAVAARTALVSAIDARRDLNAQLIGELQAAQERLQASLSGLGSGALPALPLRPFRGDLPWPARGAIARPFGRQPQGAGEVLVSNGIEIAVAEGQPVRTHPRRTRRVCRALLGLREPDHPRARRGLALALRLSRRGRGPDRPARARAGRHRHLGTQSGRNARALLRAARRRRRGRSRTMAASVVSHQVGHP